MSVRRAHPPRVVTQTRTVASRDVHRPFKIHFEFALASDIADADAAYLQRKLLPTTNAVLRQFIQVRWRICSSCKTCCNTLLNLRVFGKGAIVL